MEKRVLARNPFVTHLLDFLRTRVGQPDLLFNLSDLLIVWAAKDPWFLGKIKCIQAMQHEHVS